MVWRNGRSIQLCRGLYEECFGFIPEGMVIRHKCDNMRCINIEHIEIGTPKQNSEDMRDRGRAAFGEKNGNRKLTWKQVEQIRKEYKRYGPNLSQKYGVTKETIRYAALGITWRNAPQ